ncbi:hypothetical protein G3N95_23395 [Paraburkholderia sp. Tr-20389]|uniref:hypothetical protein n=1 Tax=Paraburkholderia sp. Tr-20389 TaxID=2703903 RepID=UPI0019803099|nr:hypothetical protein [Paraburkholderia sp. Tr-20389]MBN3755910.1 hypothetical protein [Paraburkholderia sp. Tr-20389]
MGEKEEKTLVIGSGPHQFVTCADWHDAALMNVIDYDNIVVNLASLNADVLIANDRTRLYQLRSKMARFVASGGSLFILGAPLLPTTVNKGHDNWEWCPLDVQPVAEEGDTVERNTGEFKKLLDRLDRWSFHYVVQEMSSELTRAYGLPAPQIRTSFTSFAANRYGGVLAGCVTFDSASDGWANLPGYIALLPRIPDLDPDFAVKLVLEDLLGRDQATVSFPPWLNALQMPVVAPIDSKILAIRKQIEVLEAEMVEQTSRKTEYERFKGLLYVSSFELEKLVADCLKQLGGEVKPARYSQEEFVLEHQGKVLLAECKGVNKSIALTHLRQLADYLLRYEEDEGSAGKGILFGNAWRELPPEERDTNDQPIFPENVRKRALQLDIALVSTVEFFKAFCAFLEGRVDGARVLDWLTESVGIVKAESLFASEVT